MATMLIPGHDRDAITATLDVNTAIALSDEQLATRTADEPHYLIGVVDEYTPTDEDLAMVRMFLAVSPDAPDVVGYDDARLVLDQLAAEEAAAGWTVERREDPAPAGREWVAPWVVRGPDGQVVAWRRTRTAAVEAACEKAA